LFPPKVCFQIFGLNADHKYFRRLTKEKDNIYYFITFGMFIFMMPTLSL